MDIKIINHLQENGRASITEIAKRLGIHRSTVSKRVIQLLDSGIIKIRALPNLDKLGYQAQALIIIDADYSKIEDICSALQHDFNVNLLVTMFGRSNLLVTVHFLYWEDLLNFISLKLYRVDGVNKIETYFINEIKQRYFGLFKYSTDIIKIDDIDQKIIERLSENGRITARHLANDVGISLPTCLKKIHYLLSNDLITIRALPNPTKFGFVADVFVLLQVKQEQVENICSILGSFSDIHSLYVLFPGSYTVLFGFHRNTPEELFNCVKVAIDKVSLLSPITDMKMYIRSEVKKRYYGGFLSQP